MRIKERTQKVLLVVVLATVIFGPILAMFGYIFLDMKEIEDEWGDWKVAHVKVYTSPVEERFRRDIFMRNRLYIAKHNFGANRGEHSYFLAMNKYGDLLTNEFNRMVNVDLMSFMDNLSDESATFIASEGFEVPDKVDWRQKGAVTKVKDQGTCGSCWTFSTTGALEGQHFRKTGKLIPLSEQQLLECTGQYRNLGCAGGWPSANFKYIKDNGGLDTEESYPYRAGKCHYDRNCKYVGKCHFNNATVGATDTGYANIPRGDEAALAAAVASVGPISVLVDAHPDSFRFYSHGIYGDPWQDCGPSMDMLNHAVLAVGYGPDYWLVKNSHGTAWGEEGYIRIRKGCNMAGIASWAVYPLV